MSKSSKVIVGIIIAVLMLFSALSTGLYLIIKYILPEKIVGLTVNTSTLNNVEDEDEKWIISVEYWSNHLGNGVELLDIQFNNYMDEQTALSVDPIVYGKGMQIVGTTENSISFEQHRDVTEEHFWDIGNQGLLYYTLPTSDTYFYDTSNGVSFQSINEINSDYLFRISIDDDLYAMKFIGEYCYENYWQFWTHVFKSYDYDINYFAYQIYNKIVNSNSIGYGADGQLMIDMSDNFSSMFKYKKFVNGAYVGDWLQASSEMNNKLITEFNNYFTIRVKTHESGAVNAKQTKFGMVAGDPNFEIVDSGYADNYFNGVQAVLLTEYNFEFTQFADNSYYADLSIDTIKFLEKHQSNNIKILIDVDNLKGLIDFVFLEYRISDIYKSKIISFYEVETVNNIMVYSEVTL